MSAHDRFEALAGAVALGEATPEERTAFAAHAATCDACRDDADGGTFVVARIAEAHRSESWRPSQPIVERIRARRNKRSRFTLGALGWGVGVSLVLNVALAGGAGTRLIGAFQPRTDFSVASTAISLDKPHAIVAAPAPVVRRTVAYAPVARIEPAHKAVHAPAVAGKPVVRHAPEKLPTLDDMPDVLAGLDLYGTDSTRHHVAIETLPRCKVRADADAGDATDVRPCRDATGRIER